MLGPVGLGLSLAGLIVPTSLGPIERAWMQLAHLISRVTTPFVMGSMYVMVLTPVGVLRRAFGGNPIEHIANGASYWKPRPEGHRASNLTRQYEAGRTQMGLVSELWGLMWERKKWWLLPVIVVMVVVGTLLVFAQGSVLAPFIYAIF